MNLSIWGKREVVEDFKKMTLTQKNFFFILAVLGLSCSMYVGSSSLTRDRTRVPCIGSAQSYPWDHQGSPSNVLLISRILKCTLHFLTFL